LIDVHASDEFGYGREQSATVPIAASHIQDSFAGSEVTREDISMQIAYEH
jgi:hypothetical protein